MREPIRHYFGGKYFHKCIYYQTNQPRGGKKTAKVVRISSTIKVFWERGVAGRKNTAQMSKSNQFINWLSLSYCYNHVANLQTWQLQDSNLPGNCSNCCVWKMLMCQRQQQQSISWYKPVPTLVKWKKEKLMCVQGFFSFVLLKCRRHRTDFRKLFANWTCNSDVTVSHVAMPIKNFPQDLHYVLLKLHVV